MADISSPDLPKTATYVDVLKQQAPETAKTLQSYTNSIIEGLAARLIGKSPDFQEKTLGALRECSDGIFARGAGENLRYKNLELTDIALKGVGALLSPEPMDKEGAQAMVDALRRRYSTLK